MLLQQEVGENEHACLPPARRLWRCASGARCNGRCYTRGPGCRLWGSTLPSSTTLTQPCCGREACPARSCMLQPLLCAPIMRQAACWP